MHNQESNLSEAYAVQSLLSGLGDYAKLRFRVDLGRLAEELCRFAPSWVPYNKFKPRISRFGLSLTSLDGGLEGYPDLQSLREIKKWEGREYGEMDFRTLTPVYEHCRAIRELVDYFSPLGRSHFIRLDCGGHFPWHRDLDPQTFRVIVPCMYSDTENFVFILGDKKIHLEPGWAYFVNTRLAHTVFSFADNSVQLVLNVPAEGEHYKKLIRALWLG